MSNQAKVIRGQVRQIVKELLPEMVKAELYIELANKLQKQLKDVEAQVKETLTRIDDRSKDIQSYLVRQSMITTNPADVLSTAPVSDKKDDTLA